VPGSRDGPSPGHNEWSEDHFQHGIDGDGKVVARGRTYDWKSRQCGFARTPGFDCDGWANWRNGEANLLGIATIAAPALFFYVKVD